MSSVNVYFFEANPQVPSVVSGDGAAMSCGAMAAAIDAGRIFASVARLLDLTGGEQMVWVFEDTVFVRFRRSDLETGSKVVDGFAGASLSVPDRNERQELVAFTVANPPGGIGEPVLFAMALAYAQALAFERAAADVMNLELASGRPAATETTWPGTLEHMMLWNSRVLWWESIGPDPDLASWYRSVQDYFSSKALHDQSLSEISLIQAKANERRAEATNAKLHAINLRLTVVGIILAVFGVALAGIQIWQALG